MKKKGQAKNISHIVTFDAIDANQREELRGLKIELLSLDDVRKAGEGKSEPENHCKADDSPLFSYTSGTTGDSKGVKLTHKNLISSCAEIMDLIRTTEEDT